MYVGVRMCDCPRTLLCVVRMYVCTACRIKYVRTYILEYLNRV